MKIIVDNPAEEALLWRIKALSDELVNQDNRYIKENNHHYDNPTIYVRSAHDNRELKDVIHLLILAGGNEIPSNHYGVLRDA